MVRKRVFLLVALVAMVAFVTPTMAQMSDDAVISYIEKGLSSGKSQEALMKELALKGVTQSQAERIKAKMSNSKASNVMELDASETRMRSSLSAMDMTAVDMTSMGMATMGMASQTSNMPVARVNSNDTTQVFGRNIFSINSLTFAPIENLATPADYKLGPGDEVIIDVWGANQITIRQIIAPDGFINVEEVGLLYLGGMTIKEANDYVRRKLSKIYSVDGADAQSEIKLTLGTIRTITVNVVGEIVAPGTYSLSSLSTVYHALYSAGGFSNLGSVRNVALVRNGKTISEIDIYDFIINGSSSADVVLQDGDVVLVPTYEAVVAVSGKVKRPMKYEMKKGESLADLIDFAGGFKGDAYTANINLERRNGREYKVYTVYDNDYSSFELVDGDSITVGTIINRYENRVEIFGAVYRPGVYQLSDKVNTVSELIAVADGLRGDAFINRALLYREQDDLTWAMVQVDLKGILNGSVADIELRKNDELTILNVNEIKAERTITIEGEVANPHTYAFADNMTLEEAILQAGGLLESASTARVDVSRRIKNPEGTEDIDTISRMFSFTIDGEYKINTDNDFVLEAYDHIYVRKSPGYSTQHHVKVEGEVLFPGSYALLNKATRLSDVIALSGGVSSLAYVKGAKLNRQMTDEERKQFEAALDVYDHIYAEEEEPKIKLDSIRTYSVGINMEEALANPGSDADLVLREGDVIVVPEYTNTVKISGCVLYPNTITYNPKMTVSDYISQAGGYGFRAKRNRAYIVYMNGTVSRTRRNARSIVEPGCEIIVPEKVKREDALQNFLSIASTSASLATMFGTIYSIIK